MKPLFWGVIGFIVPFVLIANFTQYQYEEGLLSNMSSEVTQKLADDWYRNGWIVAITSGGIGFVMVWSIKEHQRSFNEYTTKYGSES
jgi:hypothetical protein